MRDLIDDELACYIGISYRSIKDTYKNSKHLKYRNIYNMLRSYYMILRTGVSEKELFEIVDLMRDEQMNLQGVKDLMDYKNNLYDVKSNLFVK